MLSYATLLALVAAASAQTFQRLGTCPTLGCILPPDQQDFLAGQYFDIRLEVHAPVNGSEATDGNPDENFSLTISKVGGQAQAVTTFFDTAEPELETWSFEYYEDLFAQDDDLVTTVNVASKAYRRVALYEPGEYEVVLSYNGTTTTAYWRVNELAEVRKAKNVLLFIGDGMTTNMITAARLIAHKSINGRYQSTMAMDQFPVVGHQMTHSIDSFITDSANSATAMYSGHKSTVNCLGTYADSSPDPFDDPKFENIAEMFYRLHGGHLGVVSTAYIADATPGAMTAHTRLRGEYEAVIDSYVHGIVNYTWTEWPGVDVLFGGGAENFCPPSDGGETYMGLDYYQVFADEGYSIVQNKTALEAASSDQRMLGIFSTGNLAKWLDRNVYTDNLVGNEDSPDCLGGSADDQPGLKEMTLKAIDVLQTRASADNDAGWLLMSEAASVDKQMHALDYDRALGELLELDDTVKASIERLQELGELENTIVIVTADHGHGFDVFGNVDTKYLNEADDDRKKRNAVGTYANSGLSGYINTGDLAYGDSNFPSNWDPRYSLAQGVGGNPDRRENYQVHPDGPRTPAVEIIEDSDDYYVNPEDSTTGYLVNGTLPTDAAQGVHSLTDVAVFARGPCQDIFGGVYNSIDIFFHMANCLGLSRSAPEEVRHRGNWHHNFHGRKNKLGYKQYGPKNPMYKGKDDCPSRVMKRQLQKPEVKKYA